MLRTFLIIVTTAVLGLGVSVARADHDKELRYVIGGALIGAALGELAYSSDRHHSRYGYRHRVRGRHLGHRRYGHAYYPRYGYYAGGHRYFYDGRWRHGPHEYCRH